MYRSKWRIAVQPHELGPLQRSLFSRVLAACACVLVAPLFLLVMVAIVLHGEWRVILREKFRTDTGQTLVRLAFNTRARPGRRSLKKDYAPTSQERLADFLLCTRIAELPCLLQFAFGSYEIDTSIAIPRSLVSWESLSAWAIDPNVPQRRYGDLLMADFNAACNAGEVELAFRLYGELETNAADLQRFDPDEPRVLLNQLSIGTRRLTLAHQRLWQLRHPEPRGKRAQGPGG